MKYLESEKQISTLFSVMGNPFRIKVLYSIGEGEACVCHLEEILQKRQAYISQHLMVMRDAGILDTRRDGKYIYYRIADVRIFQLINQVVKILNIPSESSPSFIGADLIDACACPSCYSENEAANKN